MIVDYPLAQPTCSKVNLTYLGPVKEVVDVNSGVFSDIHKANS